MYVIRSKINKKRFLQPEGNFGSEETAKKFSKIKSAENFIRKHAQQIYSEIIEEENDAAIN